MQWRPDHRPMNASEVTDNGSSEDSYEPVASDRAKIEALAPLVATPSLLVTPEWTDRPSGLDVVGDRSQPVGPATTPIK